MKKKFKVLITDDNRNFCSLLKEALDKDESFEVVGVAHDGLRSVELIESINPDVVILDIIMPLLDGLGVLERVNDLELEERPKFIVMSAVGHDDITFRAINLGASYYVVKPFDLKEFLKRLKQFMTEVELKPSGELTYHVLSKDELNSIVTNILNRIGVPPHIKGYQYLRDSILLVIDDVKSMSKVTKYIYPTVAKNYDTTTSRVERAIRNAIEIAFERGNNAEIELIFKDALECKVKKRHLTNSEFIAGISEKLRVEYKIK